MHHINGTNRTKIKLVLTLIISSESIIYCVSSSCYYLIQLECSTYFTGRGDQGRSINFPGDVSRLKPLTWSEGIQRRKLSMLSILSLCCEAAD